MIGSTAGTFDFNDNGGNIIGQNPLLGALADNGGPTKTHALGNASPAINAGDPALDGTADQQGTVRSDTDIGAYELAGGATPDPDPDPDPDPTPSPGPNPTPNPGPGPNPGPDSGPDGSEINDLDATAKKSQKQKGKKFKVKISIGAQEPIDVKGSGKIKTKKPNKSYGLKPQAKTVEGGERTVLRLKLKKSKDEKKVAKAIKKWKKAPRKQKQKLAVKAPIKVKATDADGNTQTEKRVVTLK